LIAAAGAVLMKTTAAEAAQENFVRRGKYEQK